MGILVSLLEYMPGISHNKNLSLENRLVVVKGCGGEMDWEFGISR